MTDLARNLRLARKRQHERNKSRFQLAVVEQGAKRLRQSGLLAHRLTRAQCRDIVDQKPRCQSLQRLPAVERIIVVRGQKAQLLRCEIRPELYGR